MITGDFAKFAKVRKAFARLARNSAAEKHRLAIRLAGETRKLIADEFKNGVDPYGNPWAPLKAPRRRQGRKKRGDRILVDRAILQNSFAGTASSAGFGVTSPVVYGQFHQDGTVNMARRLIFPRRNIGLGEIWSRAFLKVTQTFFLEIFGRRAA